MLQRIGERDRAAMQEFYHTYHGPLTGFLRGRGLDAAAAADLVQDTMLDVWRRASSYRSEASAKSWLFTIARIKMVDRTRKDARVSYVDEVPDTEEEAPNPEAIAVSLSEASRLRACLDRLKEAHRAVLRMAFFDDMTYDEIARIEDVPPGTIKTRVFHAKKLMLRCLGTR